ncbi:PQQ-binding-like beta-propeller repeat protein [Planctellipticum variicoloris]|uniref:outer membrane protein assembly factor BamB family protein n=1 Tax=Planctellipticum variicoloris TaxID=3064265 RepID=UPI0030141700|nr:PQQ-binding-like beta-propeller repeat protein [Planctomycetaceae bacterium SH412]
MKRFAFSCWCLCAAIILAGAAAPIAAQDASTELADFPKLNAATDWPWWRGPSRNGIASATPVPTKLSETDNVVWKVPVPGRGHSSPIVVGDRVFLTTADEKLQIHSVLAFDRDTGKSLWKTDVNQGNFPAKNHAKNTEASATLACDGDRLFASFYAHDAVLEVALDLEGNVVWKEDVCRFRPTMFEYGYAPSPLIYKDTVVIAAEYDGPSFLIALDRATGKQVWETPRRNSISFSTPVVTSAGGKEQLLISGHELVAAFNPADGKPLWKVAGTTHATCGTMVWDGDIVFASGGYPKAETLAVKADGSKVLWRNNQKCYEQSMLAFDGHLYALTDGGVMFCWRGSDGKEMWKHRLTGPVSASPVLAGGNVYQANERGTLYVFKPNPEKFDLVEENQVGNDAFPSPAICGGQIFLRVAQRIGDKRQEFLYCFGK